VAIGGKPVVVETFERPLPVRCPEALCQAPTGVRTLEDRDDVTCAAQVPGGGHSRAPAPITAIEPGLLTGEGLARPRGGELDEGRVRARRWTEEGTGLVARLENP